MLGCDEMAVSTAEASGECERLPSLDSGTCSSDTPLRYYCSSSVDLSKGYLPPESPGCSEAGNGHFCCEDGWDVLPPK